MFKTWWDCLFWTDCSILALITSAGEVYWSKYQKYCCCNRWLFESSFIKVIVFVVCWRKSKPRAKGRFPPPLQTEEIKIHNPMKEILVLLQNIKSSLWDGKITKDIKKVTNKVIKWTNTSLSQWAFSPSSSIRASRRIYSALRPRGVPFLTSSTGAVQTRKYRQRSSWKPSFWSDFSSQRPKLVVLRWYFT